MQAYLSVIAIAGALAVGSISPGPSFLFVAHNSIALSRRHGFATALGMGSGACVFSVVALMGLQAVFIAVPFAFLVLKVVGGLYLVYLAFKILRAARQPLQGAAPGAAEQHGLWRAYSAGVFTS